MGRKRAILIVGVLMAAGLLSWTAVTKLRRAPQTIVLVVLDTVGFSGVFSSPAQAPFLSGLAADSAHFTNAFSTAPWTKPAIASILTASLPAVHGVRHPRSRITGEVETMAEYLSKHGFATAGFVSHTFIGPKTDYRRGFGVYKQARFGGHVHEAITSAEVTNRGLDWLKKQRAQQGQGQDLFLFLHYFDPHYNYRHHPAFSQTDWYTGSLSDGMQYREFRERASSLTEEDLRYIRGLYGEEIRHTDREIERLYRGLAEAGATDGLVLVVTGDHGEAFRQHDHMGHGYLLYNELVHVPLLLHAPGRVVPQLVSSPVSSMEIFPSVVDLLGMPKLRGNQDAASFTPLLGGSEESLIGRIPVFEVEYHTHKVGAVNWPWKVILDRDSFAWEVYNIETDPGELKEVEASTRDVPAVVEAKERVKRYTSQESVAAPHATLPPIEYSDKEIEKLKTLGYMM